MKLPNINFKSLILIIFIISSCNFWEPDNNPILPENAILEILSLDSIWVKDLNQKRQIAISVKPKLKTSDIYIECQITGSDDTSYFKLLDDGNSQILNDSSNYADSLSGDRFAGDGVFTRYISAHFASSIGVYKFVFKCINSNYLEVQPCSIYVQVRENTRPFIVRFNTPDSLGLFNDFYAIVQDSEGAFDITLVNLVRKEAYFRTEAVYSMTQVDDTTWFWRSSAGVGAGLCTGYYPWSVRVADWTLRQFNQFVECVPVLIYFENSPPIVNSVSGPDTIWLVSNERVIFHYLIDVKDPQTALDLDTLLLTISDPEKEIINFTYFDDGGLINGTSFDSIAGDGIYTAGFSVDSTSRTNVWFTFTWIPTDRSPQRGSPDKTHLIILHREGTTNGFNVDKSIKNNYININ